MDVGVDSVEGLGRVAVGFGGRRWTGSLASGRANIRNGLCVIVRNAPPEVNNGEREREE